MLVECGYVRATASDGAEFTFCPSFSRIASLSDDPKEIVSLYAGLHGPKAAQDATYVLACLCEQEDPTALLGWWEVVTEDASDVRGGAMPQARSVHRAGAMPEAEQIIIAQHLMRHGMIGKAKPGSGDGQFVDCFNAEEYVGAACVHLGLTRADAEQLSMTEFQTMFEMKFPDQNKAPEIPSQEEYDAVMKVFEERRNGH